MTATTNEYRNKTNHQLLQLGMELVTHFCVTNEVPVPKVRTALRTEYIFKPCAYYRPEEGIVICLSKCARLAHPSISGFNWTWPCYVVDREPLGVIAHELGHHCDVFRSKRLGLPVGSYTGEYSSRVREESGDAARLTSYAPNTGEWFAEMFRLFITNPDLLKRVRPSVYEILSRDWQPTRVGNWRDCLGVDVPMRIIRAAQNKMIKT